MPTTSMCSTLGVEHPVIQGPLGGPFEVGAELPAAVSNEGGLGSIATPLRTPDQVRADITAVRRLIGDRPRRRGRRLQRSVGTMTLVPQVVDAVAPIPVVAAGGITDGRGLAAALALGADGVNAGTRFLASSEVGIHEEWKRAVLLASAEDAVKVDFAEHVVPRPTDRGWLTVPRALRTPFIDTWLGRVGEVELRAAELRDELVAAIGEGRADEYLPLAGQAAGAIGEILPAAEIVRRIVTEADQALGHMASTRRKDAS